MPERSAIHVVGAPASGKTWLRGHLGSALGLPTFGIDDERVALLRPGRWWPDDDAQAWRNLAARLACCPTVVVETSGRNHWSEVLLSGRAVLRVVCQADAATRYARCVQRARNGYRLAQHQYGYAEKMARAAGPDAAVDDLVWDGAGELDGVVARVRDWLAVGAGDG